MKILHFSSLISVIVLSFLTGCKTAKDDETLLPAQTLFAQGMNQINAKKYKDSAESFSKIYYGYPGGKLTDKAEIMEAYSYYLDGKYDDALDVLDNFIAIHPAHHNLDYIYYLKAMCSYMQVSSTEFDQSKTSAAYAALEEVANLYPNTKYAVDAKLKLDLVRSHLAGKNMAVGRYYLKRNNPLAAIPRFEAVLAEYSNTAHAPEALMRLTESYIMLGLKAEAQKYASVLGHNYPDSKWYLHSYQLLK